jgi:hypothetical protein
MDAVLAAGSLHIGNQNERTLTGYLAGSDAAKDELAKFTGSAHATVVKAIHDSFVFGISNVMWLSAGLAIATALFAAVVMQRSPPAADLVEEPEPSVEPTVA